MSGRERLRNRLTNKFNHLVHSLVPGRSRLPSPSPSLSPKPTEDSQASSTFVGPDPTSIKGISTQPRNSPSLSNIYPSIVIRPAVDETPGRLAELASGYQGVKTTLRLVERATDVFPLIKSTAAGLLNVIDIVEVRDF